MKKEYGLHFDLARPANISIIVFDKIKSEYEVLAYGSTDVIRIMLTDEEAVMLELKYGHVVDAISKE